MLATYRCPSGESTSRIEIRARTLEGQHGNMKVVVIPKMTPCSAQVVMVTVKPLSLHHLVHSDELEENKRPFNSITFTGGFNLRQMHEWVCFCLPEVPERINDKTELTFFFRNCYLGTVLRCKYSKGSALFESDSVSTIAILKEVISKQATERKVRVKTSFAIEPHAIPHVLSLISPMLEYQLSLARKAELIDALTEVRMQEDEMSFLAPEYLEVIDNKDKIQKEFKDRPRQLHTLFGIVTDLYVDNAKFAGRDAKGDIRQLNQLLHNYNYEQVLAFFQKH